MKRTGVRALIVPVTLAVALAAWSPLSWAGPISIDPDGAGPSPTLTGITGFNYASSSALAFGLATPAVGATYDIFYESAVASTQGNVVAFGANFNLNNSGNAFTVIAGFRETITGINLVPGGGSGGPGGTDAAQINFSLASADGQTTGTANPNFFRIFAQPTGTANFTSGAGFANATPILTGHLIAAGFNGSFVENGTVSGGTFTPQTTTFNNSGNTSNLDGTTNTPNTVTGGGGTNLTVQVDFANPLFFPGTAPIFLTFTTTNSIPFQLVTPSSGFYDGTTTTANIQYKGAPITYTIGTTNGQTFTGTNPSFEFQTVANNGFAVPEPSSIISAFSAAVILPSFLFLKRRRGSKSIVA